MSITFQLPMTFRSKRRAIPASTADQSFQTAETRQALVAPGQISAFAWEGVYIEPSDESAESMARGTQPNPEFERFLAGLMYGE
ncbi:hypothetical protein QFZ23_004295 [Arthrobacter globiformis]|uniref:hypothetical protein n=1 Tax=Arthrobacter globiformis TaxID=1665 RepID=UPI00278B34FB|nr:hypothetical protein [Arthrobacter globiformis]MDQ1060394.1 hypothetical protein [Arthrobacter globiformis]